MTDFSIILRWASKRNRKQLHQCCASGYMLQSEQVNWWKVCLKVFLLIHFQMPAPNAEKTIFTYVCVLNNLNSIGQNASQATTRVLREWLFSSKRYNSEKCQLHWLYLRCENLSKKTSNVIYIVLNLIRAFCGVEMNLSVAYNWAREGIPRKRHSRFYPSIS